MNCLCLRLTIAITRVSCSERNIHTTVQRWIRREPLRKHVWLPRAPSKIFQIQEKVYLPRDEQDQVDHLKWEYESQLLSIRDYCRENFYLPSRSAGGLSMEQVQQIEDEHQRLLRENEEENQRVAEDRKQRNIVLKKQQADDLLQKQLEKDDKNEEIRKIAEQMVQKEIERSKTYITRDNLDAVIEEALSTPVSYEFAIDKKGNVLTEGKIHPNAFTPSATPDTSDNVMLDDKGDLKFKANRIYVPKKFVLTSSN